MGIRLDAGNLLKGLSEMELKAQIATQLYAETSATKMVNDAKDNAPWTDRTGNSRQTIDHSITNAGKKVTINLRGNTPHFKYLEFCHEKKHAILWPTIQKWSGKVLEGWVKVIR